MTNDQKEWRKSWRIELDPPEPITSENSCKKQLRNCTICGKDWVSHEGDDESRSRFKEEVLMALEGMKKENSQTLLEETGEHFYIYKCVEEELIDKVDIGYNKVIQQAIETIKGL